MADDNKLESTSSIPPMDLNTLYAGGDFSYMEDDRSTQNSDDPGAEDRGDELPPPAGEEKRKVAKEEESDDEPEDDSTGEGDEADEADDDSSAARPTDDDGEEGDGEREGEGDQEGANRVGTVPKWRLDQQTKKLRQTEREMAALQAQLQKLTGQSQPTADNQPADPAQAQQPTQQAPQNDQLQQQLKALQTKRSEIRDQYEEAIIDGDTKKTKSLREQLDAVEDDIFEVRVSARTQKVQDETVSRTAIERELQTVADEVQATYTPLDPNHESYDEELVNETVAYRDMLITSMGRKPGEALREAAETMAKKYDIPAAGKSNKAKDTAVKKESRTEQRSKGKEKVAKQQPPKMPGKRNEPKVSDIASMTDTEFDKLTPEQRAELRGDYRVS